MLGRGGGKSRTLRWKAQAKWVPELKTTQAPEDLKTPSVVH